MRPMTEREALRLGAAVAIRGGRLVDLQAVKTGRGTVDLWITRGYAHQLRKMAVIRLQSRRVGGQSKG